MVEITPTITTYDSLVKSLYVFLNRNEIEIRESVDTIILLAQQMINREYKGVGQDVYINFSVGSVPLNFNGSPLILPKPIDWESTQKFLISKSGTKDTYPLFKRTFDYVWLGSTNLGRPEFYADYGDSNWIISPYPDQLYDGLISYMPLVLPVSKSQQTNWFSVKAPEVLFYGTLMTGAIYAQLDRWIDIYGNLYKTSMVNLINGDNPSPQILGGPIVAQQ